MEVYLACLGGSLPLRITPKIGTRVERLTLAGKLSSKSLECLLSLPHNQLISLDLSRCHLPQWQPFGVYAEIVECHEASLSYMAFKCAPPPTISELASVSGRHPRLLCFPKLVRGHSDVLSVTVTDLSPRMTFSSPTGSREKYFARYDHLSLIGWDAFGVVASTFGYIEFERLLESWSLLEDGLKSSWRVTAESVEQRYREYRKFVPVSWTAPASFDLDVSSASGSEVTDLSSSWRGDSDRIGSSSSDGNDSSGSESTSSDELSGTGSSVCTDVSALLAYSLLSVAICELRVEVFLWLIVDIRMFERYRAARRRSGSDIQSIFRNEVEIARRGTLDSSFGADDDGDSKKEGELNGTPRTRSNTISSDIIAGAESPEKCATPAGSSTMLSLKGWRSSGEREESHFTKNAGTVVRHSPESFTWTIPRLDLSERIGTTRFRVCSDADGCEEMRKGAEVAIEYAKDDKNETILKLYSMRDRLGFKMMIDDKEIVVNEEAAETDRFQFAYEIRAPQLAEASPETPLNIKCDIFSVNGQTVNVDPPP
ncbi:hypothetical protein FOZ62_001144 [Perkinsus olseni]|uniref:Uncharacterized protein n=1 Tax=Perkinsus olseni TaxID=32597 RepID=A0A7J6QSM8_PEROL|nr:hypothetical protein FOZ62_001144 [Perkinsus olseni]